MYIWLPYITGISTWCLPPPAQAPRVILAFKAIDESGPPPNRKYPITFTLLQSMFLSLSANHNHIVWRAIITPACEYATLCGSVPLLEYIQFGQLHSQP